ncbi:sugar ABC transporter permease [Rhizobium sp. S152]|uniref:carbohydrate ABC transporter permease n=1 Tax=Rhizobium sp. S152 TaxID=3055038 RepID=UPI0025A956F4|nr:sugar ABC transporter permease [Rhizobium sp. S152]MDM9625216.1 sugar ABC transporter permease [Rhizobium sp. S152]
MAASAISASPMRRSSYPGWFYLPAAVIYGILFLLPTFASFYFSLTRWSLFSSSFIGLDNFAQFLREPFLIKGLVNTIIYAVITSGLKVVLGMLLAVMLTSEILARGLLRSLVFFPVLVSTIGVGITFTVLMHPTQGAINEGLALIGIKGPGWLTDPSLALISVALVDVWKGVGLATVIYIAGIVAIPKDYYEAARIDGGTKLQSFLYITLPLSRPATATVVTLSFIGGLRTFDLIWAMTKGGPGFASDTIASVIYKQYQSGFFGLSTAGNVVLFVLIAVLVVPITIILNRREGHQ